MDANYFSKPSKLYSLLRKYVIFSFNIFYDEIIVSGKENIPEKSPVIFAPNHQNALMDALAIITQIKQQPVFLAKADIFSNKIIASILNFLKILPVFRIRDGYENLGNNDTSFEIIKNCLLSNNCVGIMPEGTQTELQQLQPLKKGISRIAMDAQNIMGFENPIYIIPVGIHYSNYYNFRSKIYISFGKPINVANFLESFKINPQKAFNEIKDNLATELKNIMLSIDNTDNYQLIKDCKDIIANEFVFEKKSNDSNFSDLFAAEKEIVNNLNLEIDSNPEKKEELIKFVNEFKSTSLQLNLNKAVFENRYPENYMVFDFIRFILFFPVACIGISFNFFPAIIAKFVSNKLEDKQFVSSIKFGVSAVLYPIYYILILVLPLPLLFKVFFIVFIPLLGILAFDYFKELKTFISSYKVNQGINKNDPAISRWIYTRSQIIKIVKSLSANS